jgi:hypothetical protein
LIILDCDLIRTYLEGSGRRWTQNGINEFNSTLANTLESILCSLTVVQLFIII